MKNVPVPETCASKALRKLAEARPPFADLGLWMQLVAFACGGSGVEPASKLELEGLASKLGTLRSRQSVTIEALLEEISLIRRLVEDSILESGALDRSIRVDLDFALSSIITAYSHERSIEARRDRVTGLLDRVAFEQSLFEELARAERYSRAFSLILFDIDHFKRVNDQAGHLEGDRVLAEVGRTISSALRRSDQVFRYGGDEFAALCLETDGLAIKTVLQRVELKLQPIKISSGLACYPTDASDALGLIRLADERLFQCKKAHHQEAS